MNLTCGSSLTLRIMIIAVASNWDAEEPLPRAAGLLGGASDGADADVVRINLVGVVLAVPVFVVLLADGGQIFRSRWASRSLGRLGKLDAQVQVLARLFRCVR